MIFQNRQWFWDIPKLKDRQTKWNGSNDINEDRKKIKENKRSQEVHKRKEQNGKGKYMNQKS